MVLTLSAESLVPLHACYQSPSLLPRGSEQGLRRLPKAPEGSPAAWWLWLLGMGEGRCFQPRLEMTATSAVRVLSLFVPNRKSMISETVG